jgi:hypothetical protein
MEKLPVPRAGCDDTLRPRGLSLTISAMDIAAPEARADSVSSDEHIDAPTAQCRLSTKDAKCLIANEVTMEPGTVVAPAPLAQYMIRRPSNRETTRAVEVLWARCLDTIDAPVTRCNLTSSNTAAR